VGAQTRILGAAKPGDTFCQRGCVAQSLARRARRSSARGWANVEFKQADLLALPLTEAASTTCSCVSCWSTCAGPRSLAAPSARAADRAAPDRD